MSLPFSLGELRLASPAVLWGLLLLPFFFATAGRTLRARFAAGCRVLAAAAVLLALAGLSIERARSQAGACVVAAIDLSASVEHAALSTAREFLERLVPELGRNDLAASIVFAGRTQVVAHPAVGRRPLAAFLPSPALDVTALEPGETDLAAALTRAVAFCPEEKQAAIVLFTDGLETAGSLLAEVLATEPRVPVFPVVPPSARLAVAGVRRLLAPSLAPASTVLPLEAVVENRAAGPLSAALVLRVNGQSLPPRPVELPPGPSVVGLPYRFQEAGHYLLEAELLLPPGEPPPPGPVEAAISVTRPLRVLLVSERHRPVVGVALAERGMEITVVTPAAFPRSAELRQYHLVVLEDVARAGFSEPALAGLAQFVAAGGGLIATGGAHLFGDSGFVASPLERVLPVELVSQKPMPKVREPIAVYLVIDRSNSMGYASSQPAVYGEKMEYAKQAALAVLDQLGPHDLVGAVAFDSEAYELGPLRAGRESREVLTQKIRQLQYGGGTDFKNALDIARQRLMGSGPRVRHVILLTDGDTNRRSDDHDELIAALARAEITVTAIRIGSDAANLELLSTISRATGGAFHHVEDVQALPQLMISDAQRLIDDAVGGRRAPPRIGDPGPMLAGIAEEELPAVSRWAVTRPKPGAELRLYVETGKGRDPLLATWQYELGRSAVLPADFQAGAAAWPTWRGFAKLWSQLAVWAAPQALATDRHLSARRVREGAQVTLETAAEDEAPFVLRLPAVGDVVLRPTGRRTFTALVPNLEPGVHQARLVARAVDEPVDLVVPERATSGREYRVSAPNLALLEQVAAVTGGRVGPEAETVLAVRPGRERQRVPLEGLLVPFALALLLADVAARRLRPQ